MTTTVHFYAGRVRSTRGEISPAVLCISVLPFTCPGPADSRHDEEWDGKPNTTGEDGFFGKINEMRKKFTAEMVKAGADTTPVDQRK